MGLGVHWESIGLDVNSSFNQRSNGVKSDTRAEYSPAARSVRVHVRAVQLVARSRARSRSPRPGGHTVRRPMRGRCVRGARHAIGGGRQRLARLAQLCNNNQKAQHRLEVIGRRSRVVPVHLPGREFTRLLGNAVPK